MSSTSEHPVALHGSPRYERASLLHLPEQQRTEGAPTSASRARDRPISLAVLHRDAVTGLVERELVVTDESDGSTTREAAQAVYRTLDGVLAANPSWQAPVAVDGALHTRNPVSEWIYSAPALRHWRTHLVPRAEALYALQRPGSGHLLPGGLELDPLSLSLVVDGLDGIALRTRGRMMQDAVQQPLATALQRPGARWVSLACGAAVPVLDALANTGLEGAELHLVDVDASALRFAGELAADHGMLVGRDVHLVRRNLVSDIIVRTPLLDELGEGSAAVVDALGIFEYFSDASCVRLLRNAYRLVAPGGVLVVANMLDDRPELHFNQRGLGWPAIVPRSRERIVGLVERAGLPLALTRLSTAQDGVYAVVDVVKPLG